MYRANPARNSTASRGYALVLVMVALVTLTILGVTSITAAQLDMKITQNMRHHKALQYGALTGQDHGHQMAEDESFDPVGAWSDAQFTANHCTPDWIGSLSTSAAASVSITANGFMMADYAVDLCAAVCSDVTPPGNDLSQGQTKRSAYTIDMVSTGSMINSTADSQAGGFLMTTALADCNS